MSSMISKWNGMVSLPAHGTRHTAYGIIINYNTFMHGKDSLFQCNKSFINCMKVNIYYYIDICVRICLIITTGIFEREKNEHNNLNLQNAWAVQTRVINNQHANFMLYALHYYYFYDYHYFHLLFSLVIAMAASIQYFFSIYSCRNRLVQSPK